MARIVGMPTQIKPMIEPPSTAVSTLDSPVGQALRQVRLSGVFYCPSFLTEPWGLSLPPMPGCIWFHIITKGSCTFEARDGVRSTLRAGDLVLVPHGDGHRSWGKYEVPTPSVLDLPHEELTETFGILRYGAGGESTEMVCGGVRLDHPAAKRLTEALPPLIRIESDLMPRSDWLRATLDLMADETSRVRPGSDAVVSRLCDIIVMQALRTWMETDPSAQEGWLGALHDPRIGRAMAQIHTRPEHPWSVAELAEVASMSRSAFASRFTELVGESAMRYVTEHRMQVAKALLEGGEITAAAAGRRVGYDSEAAFSRAFSRVVGVPPSQIRLAGQG